MKLMQRYFLSGKEIQAFYDQFGKKQNWQNFYEGQAMKELFNKAGFETSLAVF